MSDSQKAAITLAISLTAVVCLAVGFFAGVIHMRSEALRYGHAETGYMVDGEISYLWRWKK